MRVARDGTMTTQGAMANKSGHVFEKMAVPVFEANGYPVVAWKQFREHPLDRCAVKDVPFINVYGSQSKTEFVIVDGDRRIRVECKFQTSAGSVDEKFPYMYLNSVLAYPEREVILIIDGDGYRPGARQWVIDRVNENWLGYKELGKSIMVMRLTQFTDWVNHGMPCGDGQLM